MNVLGIIASGVAALFITVVLAKGARRAALRLPVPYEPGGRAPRTRRRAMGGATVVLGVGTAAGGALWLGAVDGSADPVAGMLAGAAIVAALGLVHDLKPLRAALRLAVQWAAAVLVVCLADLSPAAGALAVLWIVLVTNAFALLDHSDGALPAVGIVTASGLLACAALDGGTGPALLPAALAAGLIGFLPHSWRPARLHLGGCGAQFTGFVLASSGALIQAVTPSGRAAWAALPVLATVALADAALVVISRRRAGRSPLRDAEDHIAHRLRRVRVTVPGTAILLALWAGVSVAAGTLVYAQVLHPALLLVPSAGTVAAVLALLRIPAYSALPRPAARRTPTGRAKGATPTAPTPSCTRLAPAASAAPSGPGAPALARPTPVTPAPAPAKPEPITSAPAFTAAGHPTVPPPPAGRSVAPLAAERS
ncbi:undecaprenyl-phosphate alpha-N-acetylglucosaminyl 1-phosphate transferase [Streptomyces sp. WZ.A104]|uniref:MraY family glycosyltransferase n=1 Tax=Streptomyces sp. WZ.A104 TaxID=2023771 RepID=UPI000BBCD350|nr:MraY family glycosyltransferase [Streptomyces sp. WZ.A104]PCG83279.1 undecaprenyl-phosphate alpha-N-acetylglucosaminyl 1-phosphate transferase [Streptomyces sp. WZ.A104]